MKRGFIIIVLFCASIAIHAQSRQSATYDSSYGLIKFDANVADMENRWVAFPKNAQITKFRYGFIYLDPFAGFTVDMDGSFDLDPQGNLLVDSVPKVKTASVKIRLGNNTVPVYPMPAKMIADLKLQDPPSWLAIYQRGFDRNTVAGKVTLGKHLNTLGASQKALSYLESAYKTDPNAAGLIFELTYAYNEQKRYDDAIRVLNAGMAADPNNPMFYRELGFAYNGKGDVDNAIAIYKKGLEMDKINNETKAEMALNLAVIYRDKKNDPENFKLWGQKAKDLAPPNSQIGQRLRGVQFN